MRDTRTGAARKETPKGAAVDRTGKRGMPTPAGKAKATEVTKAKTAEALRAGRKAPPADTKRQEMLAARNERLKRLEEEARREAAREKERRQKAAEERRAKAKGPEPKIAGRYKKLAGQ